MYKDDDDRVSTQNPGFVIADRAAKNAKYIKLYSDSEQAAADSLLGEVQSAFFRRRCYLNYNLKDISIKVSTPKMVDLVNPEVAALEKRITANGIKIKIEKNGNRIYHL